MIKMISICMLLVINIFAIEFGNMLYDEKNINSKMLANDISMLLEKYKINLSLSNSNNSYNSIDKLINNKENNFFSIVKKDSISYYNRHGNVEHETQSIYKKIPVILSLGAEAIHIFADENKEIDFELNKKYNIFCGEEKSDSCIASKNIQKAYDFDFTYKIIDSDKIIDSLKDNTIDLYISVSKAPNKEYTNFKGIKLVDLPTNFVMEDMYIHEEIKKGVYSYVDEDLHVFSSPIALISNLSQEKYSLIIKNFVKIIILNQKYLIKNNNDAWKDVEFEYFDFKNFSRISKKTIIKLSEDLKKSDALIF